MKTFKYSKLALLALMPAMLFTACSFEDEDLFDESPALRIEHATDELKDILTTPDNGWVLQYFCGTGVAHFEGFNLFARFNANEKVTIAGNHRMLRNKQAGKYTEAESLYEILQEDGLVLAFNTWNDVLTPFVDPVNPWAAPNNLVKDGAGMEGDHNFVITSYNDGEVVMRGERHSAEVRLVACDRSWEDYIADANKTKGYISNSTVSSYYITNSVDTMYLTGVRNGRIRMSERIDDPLIADSLASVFTPRGFRLEHETTLGKDDTQTKFHEFTLAEDSTCLLSEDGKTKVMACWDNYVVDLEKHANLWIISDDSYSDQQKALIEQINQELKAYNANCSFAHFSIGQSKGNKRVNGLVLSFYADAAKRTTASVGLALDVTKTSFAQMKIYSDEDSNVDRNMTNISARATSLEALVREFAQTLNGEYKIIPNNYFAPTGATFEATDGSKRIVAKQVD